MKRLLILFLALTTWPVAAQRVTYTRMAEARNAATYPSGKAPEFQPAQMRSLADGRRFVRIEGDALVARPYTLDGRSERLFEVEGGRILSAALSPDESLALLELLPEGGTSPRKPIYRHSFTSDYTVIDRSGRRLAGFDGIRDVAFSPDSRSVAYAKDNDLYLFDLAKGCTTRLTDDGEWNATINGTTDWVYEEEYGSTKAYAFSPDSRYVAFLRFDESRVPLFEMMRYDGELYNRAYRFKYPKAGDDNSIVTLHVYDIATGRTQAVPTGDNTDQYIPCIGWTPAGELYFYRVNRKQNLFEVVVCDDEGGLRTIYREQSPRYVERPSLSTVTFLDGNRFIVREETSTGWFHLYLHDTERGRIRPLTSGEWEVVSLVGVDARGRYIYYISTEQSPLCRNLYRLDMRSGRKTCLGDGGGEWRVYPSQGMNYYAATHSTASSAPRSAVYDAEGRIVCDLDPARPADAAAAEPAFAMPEKRFCNFTTERGDKLDYYLIYPAGFDPSRRYPVLLTQYSGPGSQQVADRWGGDWEETLALNGYIVACCDGRGTGFRGEEFKKVTYGDLGRREVEDQLSFARHLASQPYVDSSRIGIYGWSYGGFMALGCALKGDGLFRMAIAVAPVTSWRYYDSIYTEIYNDLPQDNPAGYDDNSPINFADRLSSSTRLLIVHGTADDNVHFQNAMEMCRALNRAGKLYDMMIYPDQNHSMMPDAKVNIREKLVEYTLQNL